jgi:hypothetical protein
MYYTKYPTIIKIDITQATHSRDEHMEDHETANVP